MAITCCLTKAAYTHSEYVIVIAFPLMVTRTRLNVTLHVQCVSRYFLNSDLHLKFRINPINLLFQTLRRVRPQLCDKAYPVKTFGLSHRITCLEVRKYFIVQCDVRFFFFNLNLIVCGMYSANVSMNVYCLCVICQ